MFSVSLSDIERLSKLRREPAWLLAWRVNAYYCVLFCVYPRWAHIDLSALEFSAAGVVGGVSYECPPLVARRALTDIDIVCDASSVYLQVSKELKAFGIRFAPVSKALFLWSARIRRYMGSVVCHNDNYFSMLNSCMFTDGTYIDVPIGVRCPTNLSTYFKIGLDCAGQFERTLVILGANAAANYFEGCNAAKLNKTVVHAAVVELVLSCNASLKYTTLQNWYVAGSFGVYNLVTKRALCKGINAKIVWVQVEIGAVATWKYPSSVLAAARARAEFYSLSVSNKSQQIDTGTKVFHLAESAASTVLVKSVLFGRCDSSFRALIHLGARNTRNHTRCDALITSDGCVSRTVPILIASAFPVFLEYEALSSYITAIQLRYCKQRGIDEVSALKLIITGYSYEVTKHLPLAASLEVNRLLFSAE
ncbi:SufD family Fe-S cluster assembly protein [Candidatus Hodgkinia cicadicola]